jgi:polyketide synthase PksN
VKRVKKIDSLSILYNQIKEQKISPEDAAKQIKEFKTQIIQGNEQDIVPEVYVYDEPYLRDHTVFNQRVLIGVTYGSLVINYFFKLYPQEDSIHLHRLDFIRPIELTKGQQVEVLVEPVKQDFTDDFQVMYRYTASSPWDLVATGKLQKTHFPANRIELEGVKESLKETQQLNRIYTGNRAVGLGDSFKTITQLYTGSERVLARVDLRQTSLEENHEYVLHPLIINSAFLAVAPLLGKGNKENAFLPFGIKEIYYQKTVGLEQCWLLVKLVKNSGEMIIFDVDLISDDAQVIAQFLGCSLKRLHPAGQISTDYHLTPSAAEPQWHSSDDPKNTTNLSGKIQQYLLKKLGKIAPNLKLSNLEANLMDLGFQSSQLVAVANELEQETKIELYPTLFFEYPNIKELTEFFSQEHQDSFKQFLGNASSVGSGDIRPAVKNNVTQIKPEGLSLGDAVMKIPAAADPNISTESGKVDIAVIGMHGLFPGASNLNQFWHKLCDKKDLIKEIPLDHWDYRPWYDQNRGVKDKTYCKWGSFIDDVDKFDADFFNISPREAEWMDPQIRLLLQNIYATGEDAGYINQLRGTNTGVFVGVCSHDYADKMAELNLPVDPYIGTGNSHTVIANRISFSFNFTGPSIAVDTACSSSLFALHQACHALRNKECSMAFVGGVNLLLSSWHYRYFSSIGALSPTGRCHTFDAAADGYVPGEFIGSILLKPLQQAKRDGDHIYAIIKGSAALHGGYTPSLTAPSVTGEENVILKAWENAGIDPETITYIEAHGTGTTLGDPIEVNSLKKAFKRFTKREHFCAIGSVKASIGHPEGAAGLAAILKVILQLKHRKIPAMPRFNKLNPYIQLDNSALYINQELEEWESPAELPRRAGVSSFGYAGTNAHVILEEYLPVERERPTIPAIIVLSAKNQQGLEEQARQLLAALMEEQYTDRDLLDMAYTLQVGREAMEERLGVIVGSIEELTSKLQGFVAGRDDVENLYQGQVKRNKETMAVFTADEEMQETIEKWVQRQKYSKLLDLWVKGLVVDWNKLYPGTKPGRISLPTYPFAKERYWLPEINTKTAQMAGTAISMSAFIHPLLHCNTSNLSEQRFSSTFTGEEFFLADHLVQGQRVLPGVAYLELARAAVEQAAGPVAEDQSGIRLKNVVWIKPIVAGEQPVPVHIRLFPEDNGEIAYEIYSQAEKDNAETVIHSQGMAALCALGEVPTLDIQAIKAQCSQSSLSSGQYYQNISSTGIDIGPRLQGIEMLYLGSGQVLGRISLPSSVFDTKEQFFLHPTLLDSALQTVVGLTMESLDTGKPVLPFAIEEIEIFGRCTPMMWALVRYSDGNHKGDKVQKFNIDLCDEQGNVCVLIKGLLFRRLEGEAEGLASAKASGTLMLQPVWREAAVVRESTTADYARHLVILCEPGAVIQESVEAQKDGERWLIIESEEKDIGKRFQKGATQVFAEIQNILKDNPKGKVLIQAVVFSREEQQLFAGLSGLLRTAELENPKLVGQLIEVEAGEDFAGIAGKLEESGKSPADKQIKYQVGKRYVAGWSEAEVSEEVKIPWQERGVYLITGGAGGLGLIFAEEIAHHVNNATLVLTGRSVLNEDKETKLKELRDLGARIEYKIVDVTQKQAVADLIGSIQEDFGNLNGIIHGAGLIRDNFILKKSREELQEVLAPKVSGLVNLDEASKDLSLDFFVLFSSIAGSLGNSGQADYATANAFMDVYAKYRNALVAVNQRQGQTVSINWPLWKEGGMHVDAAIENMMRQNTGMIALETPAGIQALYQGLASGKDRFMIMEGNLARMKQKLFSMKTDTAPEPEKITIVSSPAAEINTASLLDKVQAVLRQDIAKLLKVKSEDIDSDTELSKYGFDSITLTEFANKLNQQYNFELTPAIFFEYPTIRSFAEYLIKEHQAVFAAKFAARTGVNLSVRALEDERGEILTGQKQRSRFARTVALTAAKPALTVPEPVAIVGMSGRFPMARDVNEFWRNLTEGKDCITEIPEERWDWREYYGDPGKEENKTNIKWGGFIDGVAEFDPLFFGISPKEAELMDPQQRLLMTYVWKAIEDAGYSAQSLSGSNTGIFVGTTNSGYNGLISKANVAIEGYSSTGMVPSVGPNRMSYFLNVHGPSEPIETACSSSLIALHRAVSVIENGNCDMAIAGGVNTIVTPDLHISFNKAGMLCEDGRCKTFSDKANGYVRGEGVGMLLLKSLKAAERDGDHIYGVIRGTAENHGGRANSLTAPNPKAQTELLKTAYRKAGIDPRTVTYIEAHGTGTELGDPIEITGLKTAFKDLYQAAGDAEVVSSHCGLGSVKTNIGHLELAAGIAGVIKVLLQLKHKTLAKSLHCDTMNPYIQLKDSPFYIVQETKEWEALKDDHGKDIPRRAGVSSFGFGGANSHVVIEEYIPKNLERTPILVTGNPFIIVLSAKNEKQLLEQARQLLAEIRERQFTDDDLADMAYTLQVGREAMEERLAVTAVSIKELTEKLQAYLEDQDGIEDIYRGQVKRNKDTLAVFTADEDLQKAIEAWIAKGKYSKLLDLWVKGLVVDWNKLYPQTKPRRISLPTYPFTRERYWLPEINTKLAQMAGTTINMAAFIHPLLHCNTSNLSEQRFSSTFTGEEFFLADHVMQGRRVLPGVAYLELARAAVEQATGSVAKEQSGIRLKNVVWIQPIVAGEEPVSVHIRLFPEDNGEIAYEIYSQAEKDNAEMVMHSQGTAALCALGEVPTLDIQAIKAQCSQSSLSAGQCYKNILSTGLDIGSRLQGIEMLYLGSGQGLGRISLPSSVFDTKEQFFLHPTLLDSALQTVAGLTMDSLDTGKPVLPFAIEELEIFGRCTPMMWALVRYSDDNHKGDKVQKFNIDLCDEQGNVCVLIKGLLFRRLEGEEEGLASGTLMLQPVWREAAVAWESTIADYARHLVILCEPGDVIRESVEAQKDEERWLILKSEEKDIGKRFQKGAAQVFAEIQNILKDNLKGKVLIQAVVFSREEQQLFAGLSGLLKTAELENPKLVGQLIEVEAGEDFAGIAGKLEENGKSPADKQIKYQVGKRYVADWSQAEVSEEVKIPWQDRGVYLITGGAGGLGLIFAKEIARKVKNTTLILTGRSLLDENKQRKIKELEALGAVVDYKAVDVTDKQAVKDLIQGTQENFGSLHGIIHSAGVIRDNFILKKSREELQEVLAPKVSGLVNLDEASKDLSLDFFVLFSSIAGSLGNSGQADYAAANAFMDVYAKYRNALVSVNQRQGQTLSINWPLWKEGGMHVDAAIENMMRQNMGMTALETLTGIQALYQGLASGKDQFMIMEGNLARMKQKLFSMKMDTAPEPERITIVSSPAAEINTASLLDKVQAVLRQDIAKLLKVKNEDIEPDTELSKYGFDSITLTVFANKLNQQYNFELTPAIFFEYPTIRSFAEYLIKEHQAVFAAKFAVRNGVHLPVRTLEDEREEIPAGKKQRSRFARTVAITASAPALPVPEAVAIVGMSGRFPMARDVNEFWKNLTEGKDCITEIPEERWDWREYYGDPGKEENKTNIKWGGFIDGVAEFDPLFFGISPKEAELMDPQQRLLMTYVWKAIEDAGYSAQSLSGTNTAIFAGTGGLGYNSLVSRANIPIEGYTSTGTAPSVGPNRMSYFLNIHGPSEPIETACSSSLIALHRAVSVIENGSCDMAIAGGVNTIVNPELHISFNKAGMLSEDGRCKTFSDKANGYVRGEGVGMLLLKSLKAAERDGDHIYGVIQGTAENHGGRANSLTAPNPKAQTELLKAVYSRAGIDPRTVTYIEAHGTGTELGDPIEITGLKTAFKDLYQAAGDPQVVSSHCGLGSVKTNIGHLELAAGIAGVIKVLLQLKHKTLVKSLHCDTMNPYIQLKDTPFYIVQETKKWEALKDDHGKDLPRRAGVSSFGFGGANSHVVIEEYVSKNLERTPILITGNPAIIVLSAKNEKQLREQARQLLAALMEEQYTDRDLLDMAYTLQVGREAMEERLGIIVGSIEELTSKLQGFVSDRDDVENLYRGQIKRNKETMAVFTADEEMQETIEKWVQRQKYSKLLDLWVKGLVVDWNKLYPGAKPGRISLPTYPFAKERYWLPEINTKPVGMAGTAISMAAFIHPLLHSNTSNLSEQRFSSTFTGEEFFLADHLVQGQRVLPGVAYLELARAAVEQAAGPMAEDQSGIRLKNVVWIKPIVAGKQPVPVHISLFPEDNGEISYEIYSNTEADNAETIIHSQGIAALCALGKAPTLDLQAIKAQCSQSSLSSGQSYKNILSRDVDIGPRLQGIEMLYLGSGQVLARISLPSSVFDSKEQFFLHPTLLDSAVRAVDGLTMDSLDTGKPVLPFAIEELEIFGRCTPTMWALIRYSNGSHKGDKVQKFNIDLCDEQGNICVLIKGLLFRRLEGGAEGLAKASGTLMLQPVWREAAIVRESTTADYTRHLVILCEPGDVIRESVEAQMDGERWLIIESEEKDIGKRFQKGATQVFAEIQNILKDNPKGKVLIQAVVFSREEQQLFAGLSGLLRTAELENPKLVGQLIEVEAGEDFAGIAGKLEESGKSPADKQIKYQVGKRYVAGWSEAEVSEEVKIPWQERGVYLITGGAGGLGFIFAREIARKVKEATVILTGRSLLSEDRQARLKEVEDLGARVEYKIVDVTQKQAVVDLIGSIQEDFGNLNGIIHGAGLIRDNFILKKSREELQEVLAPKVLGLVNLDEASKDLSLDFFVLFSSIAGSLGNSGQADYATANAFMDVYAKYRNTLVAVNQRQGQTVSINWPLWKEGGMHVDAAIENMMRQNTGMIALETTTGIQALYQGLASGKDQVLVLEGDLKRLRTVLLEQFSARKAVMTLSNAQENGSVAVIGQDILQEKAANYFKRLLASTIKLPVQQIEADVPLERYGMDSIIVIQLANQLEKTFGSLSKTLFFEYQTIQELTGYFLTSYRDQLVDLLGIEEKAAATIEHSPTALTVAEPVKTVVNNPRRSRFTSLRLEEPQEKPAALDIAIIGVSGRYPKAKNIQELWEVLREGRDCITEVPTDRWDHSLYFDEDKAKSGKTYCKWGGFIEGVDEFDPLFFGISPKEAELIDPHERLFLENVWNLFEDIGYTRENLQQKYQGKVGVYVGAMHQQYHGVNSNSTNEAVGVYHSIANRVSYFFNFTSPSIAVDTACSSSATAIHMACESLKNGDCQLAIAGGVNLLLHPKKYLGLSMFQVLGSHADSRSFGDGDGYLPAEGVGAVLLKPLSKAIQDQDSILAVIKSTTVNHSGHSNGFLLPNLDGQAQLIEENFIKSGFDPRTIGYVEAAANGSTLGDPIEVAALNKVFQKYTSDRQFCAIGSIKSNLGHAEAASGISQLSKVILQLQHKQLVPSIKAESLNPNLQFSDTSFRLQREFEDWKRCVIKVHGEEREFPRRATVSSFGAGGSYAHLIVEEYIPVQGEMSEICSITSPQIMIFSAKNQERLRSVIEEMLKFIESQQELSLSNLAYTLQIGREAMETRAAMVVNTREEMIVGLKDYLMIDTGKMLESSIPIFRGGLEADHSGIRSLLSGEVGETVVRMLLAKKNLEKIALHWTQGGKIPWESLHEGQKVRRISLPTYPFEKRRCWTESRVKVEQDSLLDNISGQAETMFTSIDDQVITIVCRLLGMSPAEVDLHKPMNEYGFDSIILMQLLQQLQTQVNPAVDLVRMQESRTIQDIINAVRPQTGDISVWLAQQNKNAMPAVWPQFPELIHLNKGSQGRPVFWFPPIQAGVEVYSQIAQKVKRPFYGIQARGWMTDCSPLYGVQRIASYYVHIVQSVQPEGPYDLGGYSLGGIFAYEVTRQLQELGQVVNTIVLLDTPDSTKLKQVNLSPKSRILQAVNMALTATVHPEPEKLPTVLIHRDEVDSSVDDEQFLKQLIELAKTRGLTKTETQLYSMIQQIAKIQKAYELENYSVLPLPDAQTVTCYYFRNKSGLFLGNLEPYYTITPDEFWLDHMNYWEEWERYLPNFYMKDVDSSNHMVLLSEAKSYEQIGAFYEKLVQKKNSRRKKDIERG